MATYVKSSKSIPSSQRAVLITDVAAGDQIDLADALGRPAKKVIFLMTNSADIVEYKINHLQHITPARSREEKLTNADQVWGVFGKETINTWSGHSDTFTGTGSSQLETTDGLFTSAIEIVTLTLSAGATITLEVS